MNLQSAEVSCSVSNIMDASADIQYEDNKGFAEDLSEGKFSFPVVHGIRADGSNRQILSQSSVSL